MCIMHVMGFSLTLIPSLMKKILCVLRDDVAQSFGLPVCFDSPDVAVRSFCDLLRDTDTLYGKHPGDFSLYKIADFDPVSACVTPCDHDVLFRGLDFSK